MIDIPPGLTQSELQDLLERWANDNDVDYKPLKSSRSSLSCKSCGNEVLQEDAFIFINDRYGLHMTTKCMEPYFDSIMKDDKTIKQFFRKES